MDQKRRKTVRDYGESASKKTGIEIFRGGREIKKKAKKEIAAPGPSEVIWRN